MAEMDSARALFLHELRDILYAERQLEKTLPKLAREASDADLANAFQHHREETREQIANLERVFEAMGEKPRGQKCPGIEGILAEHEEFVSEEKPSQEILDVFLTTAGARTEHYEIAAYTGLVAMAKALGESDCADLLQANLAQEKETLKKMETMGRKLGKSAAKAAV
jgi:ferritin-like metal-binding protein YciE